MTSNKASRNPISLLILTIIYFIATVLPHEIVGSFLGSFFEESERARYDRVMLMSLVTVITLYSAFLLWALYKNKNRVPKTLLFLGLTLILCFLAMKYLIVLNSEMVHFIQYGILAALVFHLVRRYDMTMWVILILAFIDESYQHFFLTPNRFAYLDINDVFLDLIGAGFGLTSLYALGKSNRPANPGIKKGILITYGTIVIGGLILWIAGILAIWPAEDGSHAFIQLYQTELEGFWSYLRKGTITFHIFRPLEGILICLATCMLYSLLGDKKK